MDKMLPANSLTSPIGSAEPVSRDVSSLGQNVCSTRIDNFSRTSDCGLLGRLIDRIRSLLHDLFPQIFASPYDVRSTETWKVHFLKNWGRRVDNCHEQFYKVRSTEKWDGFWQAVLTQHPCDEAGLLYQVVTPQQWERSWTSFWKQNTYDDRAAVAHGMQALSEQLQGKWFTGKGSFEEVFGESSKDIQFLEHEVQGDMRKNPTCYRVCEERLEFIPKVLPNFSLQELEQNRGIIMQLLADQLDGDSAKRTACLPFFTQAPGINMAVILHAIFGPVLEKNYEIVTVADPKTPLEYEVQLNGEKSEVQSSGVLKQMIQERVGSTKPTYMVEISYNYKHRFGEPHVHYSYTVNIKSIS